MNIVTDPYEWREIRKTLINKSIGFVHTMGNLHAGHLSLCKKSKLENDITVATIFVNPTQFNEKKDFELYPRTLDQDKDLLRDHAIDFLFLPKAEDLYADNYEIQISETNLSACLEGHYRPGHFIGMLSIVLKHLNIIQPTCSYYGEKDFQQLLLIKKMVKSLFLPVTIVGCPTIRDPDGLALSSRNSRLSLVERQNASHFPRLLRSKLNLTTIISELTELNFKVDYVAEEWGRRLGAVWMGAVRLIDNVEM